MIIMKFSFKWFEGFFSFHFSERKVQLRSNQFCKYNAIHPIFLRDVLLPPIVSSWPRQVLQAILVEEEHYYLPTFYFAESYSIICDDQLNLGKGLRKDRGFKQTAYSRLAPRIKLLIFYYY